MEEFDQNLTLTLEVYLSYLQMFVTMIQSDSALLVSSSSTKSLLEEEWAFVKQVCLIALCDCELVKVDNWARNQL